MKTLDRTKLATLINETKGGFFSVTFTKVDGSIRKMICRKGVKYCLKGGTNKVVKESNSYIVAFDIAKRAYRTINLATVFELRFGGQIYVVV